MNYKQKCLATFPGLPAIVVMATLLLIALWHTPARSADEKPEPVETAATDEKTPPSDATKAETRLPTEPGTDSPTDTATPDAAAASADVPDAAVPGAVDLLDQVRSKLQALDSLKCELHETVMMGGMTLNATGTYAEASGNRVHVEFRIFPSQPTVKDDVQRLAIDAEPSVQAPETARGEMIQVSDGTVLFTHMKNGANERLTRRNLRDVMDAATKVAGYNADHVAMDLGVGGLRGLISRIESLMEFAPVQTKKVGETDFYVVRGRWNEKTRREVFHLRDDIIVDPRPHVPEYVVFYIDVKTSLPRRIEYRKRAPDPAQKFDRPMVVLDLRNIVLNETLPENLFAFSAPEGVKEEDVTEQTIQAIQQAGESPGTTPAPTSEVPATEVPTTDTPK